jgi:hypothetical protein
MNLKPDGTGTKLAGNILFMASYQKKTPTRATTARPATTGAASPQPAVANATATNQPKAFAAPRTKITNSPPPAVKPATNSSLTRPSTNASKVIKK